MAYSVFKKLKIVTATLLLGLCCSYITTYSAKAFTLSGHDYCLTIVALGKEYSFYYPEIDYFKGEAYLKNAKEVVDGIFYDTVTYPTDASVSIFPELEYPFKFKKESYGKAIDKDYLTLQITSALKKEKSIIYAKEVVLKPKITIENLQKSTYRRAYFSTNFAYSSKERKHNIGLCAKYIGGVTLFQGEEFSFNKVVGERTEERGFKSARVIENGRFTDGLGGGVCQVSSTVYNAVLLGGLKVSERHAHSMSVSYVEPSFDAMVSMGYADLKFVNDTGGIVFIIAKIENDNICITVYGEEQKLTYNRVYEVIDKISPPDYLRVYADGLLKGEEKIVVYPKDGLISKGYLEIYKDGKMIDKKLLSQDKYKPIQGEILYG